MLILSCRLFKRKFVPYQLSLFSPKQRKPQSKCFYIYGEYKKIPFLKLLNNILVMIIVLFVLFNLMVNYLYKNIGYYSTNSYFSENGTRGLSYFKSESGNAINKLSSFSPSILRIRIRICAALYCGRSGNDEYSTKLNFDTTSTPVRLIVVIFYFDLQTDYSIHKFKH